MRNMNQEQRDQFVEWMTLPLNPKGTKKPSPFTEEQEAQAFMDALGTLGKKAG